jgi:transposase InsO family protein
MWVNKLFGYDITVEYRPGTLNGATDALSRRDEDMGTMYTISSPSFDLFATLKAEVESDPQVAAICKQLADDTASLGWTTTDGLLRFKGKVFIPEASSLWSVLLAQAHESGHEGVQKAVQRWRTSFYSPKALHRVREFVRSCAVCQRNKTQHLHPAGLLQPLPIPSMVWADISMDFIEGFPKVGGKSVVLTVVDRFSKYGHFIALGHPYTAVSVAKAFFDDIVKLHGLPCSIVSDRDTVFTSQFWTELFHMAGVKLQMSSAFHPQSDGQSEVVNRIITMYLRCLAGDRPKSWLKWLPWAEYCYNSSYQSALKCSPFKVVYGRDPPPMVSYQPGNSKVAAIDVQLQDRDAFLEEIKARLVQAQVTMKSYQDQRHREVEFSVGDWVWLRLQQRTAVGVTTTSPSKLGPKFYGPYDHIRSHKR